ncbi:precorrin-6y C5,15-methyltransferase (decarboxylating) subunit CbiE [Spiractinospora alimapuensis]|uniref:precorrin-6y C5,15-methyltransferase (decarboxylating) subunit CbiE n=1 Tax=Spiractinospora alimapuensis TaxID=2820884 RepID=UPI001F2B2CE6|nr:precorrin-6y C5,15-methyltransferase (decarboxylating) subunit CbiE [Spiractinospora alimapuensis]
MEPTSAQRTIAVVGVGADGWNGLTLTARDAVTSADVVFGSARQLALIPARPDQEHVAWPSPLLPALGNLLASHAHRARCVLASGDPMFHGIGATLARTVGSELLRVHPRPSSASLACARLGWPLATTEVLSTLTRPLDALRRALYPGRRILLLSDGAGTPRDVATLLTDAGYGPSHMTVLEELGGPHEQRRSGTADAWSPHEGSALNVVAIDCVAQPGHVPLGLTPGLPDTAFEHDGQLTKREVRAVTLARLAPVPGALLWDVGAGSGSISVEWLRSHPSCRAIAVESHDERVAAIGRNAARLGVPQLEVRHGRAPDALRNLDRPDAVFVGGGGSDDRVLRVCWDALRPGGRLVVNAVTLQAQAVVTEWQQREGGTLTRLSVEHLGPVGSRPDSAFSVWRPALPVVQWEVSKQ